MKSKHTEYIKDRFNSVFDDSGEIIQGLANESKQIEGYPYYCYEAIEQINGLEDLLKQAIKALEHKDKFLPFDIIEPHSELDYGDEKSPVLG